MTIPSRFPFASTLPSSKKPPAATPEASRWGKPEKARIALTCCVALIAVLFALSGPPLGFNWTIYIAYLIPPILVTFVVLQTLRFAVRKPGVSAEAPGRASAAIQDE